MKGILRIYTNKELVNTFEFNDTQARTELAKIYYSKIVYLTKTREHYAGLGKLQITQHWDDNGCGATMDYKYEFTNCDEKEE